MGDWSDQDLSAEQPWSATGGSSILTDAAGYQFLRQHPRVAKLGEGAYAEVSSHARLPNAAEDGTAHIVAIKRTRLGPFDEGVNKAGLRELLALQLNEATAADRELSNDDSDALAAASKNVLSDACLLPRLFGAFVLKGRLHCVVERARSDLESLLLSLWQHWAAVADVIKACAEVQQLRRSLSDSAANGAAVQDSKALATLRQAETALQASLTLVEATRPPPFTFFLARCLANYLLRALRHAHLSLGLLHQDVKPGNLLLHLGDAAPQGKRRLAALTDWGMAVGNPTTSCSAAAAGSTTALVTERSVAEEVAKARQASRGEVAVAGSANDASDDDNDDDELNWGDDDGDAESEAAKLARTGRYQAGGLYHQVATVPYRAPELLFGSKREGTNGAAVAEAADVWAAGCMLAELLKTATMATVTSETCYKRFAVTLGLGDDDAAPAAPAVQANISAGNNSSNNNSIAMLAMPTSNSLSLLAGDAGALVQQAGNVNDVALDSAQHHQLHAALMPAASPSTINSASLSSLSDIGPNATAGIGVGIGLALPPPSSVKGSGGSSAAVVLASAVLPTKRHQRSRQTFLPPSAAVLRRHMPAGSAAGAAGGMGGLGAVDEDDYDDDALPGGDSDASGCFPNLQSMALMTGGPAHRLPGNAANSNAGGGESRVGGRLSFGGAATQGSASSGSGIGSGPGSCASAVSSLGVGRLQLLTGGGKSGSFPPPSSSSAEQLHLPSVAAVTGFKRRRRTVPDTDSDDSDEDENGKEQGTDGATNPASSSSAGNQRPAAGSAAAAVSAQRTAGDDDATPMMAAAAAAGATVAGGQRRAARRAPRESLPRTEEPLDGDARSTGHGSKKEGSTNGSGSCAQATAGRHPAVKRMRMLSDSFEATAPPLPALEEQPQPMDEVVDQADAPDTSEGSGGFQLFGAAPSSVAGRGAGGTVDEGSSSDEDDGDSEDDGEHGYPGNGFRAGRAISRGAGRAGVGGIRGQCKLPYQQAVYELFPGESELSVLAGIAGVLGAPCKAVWPAVGELPGFMPMNNNCEGCKAAKVRGDKGPEAVTTPHPCKARGGKHTCALPNLTRWAQDQGPFAEAGDSHASPVAASTAPGSSSLHSGLEAVEAMLVLDPSKRPSADSCLRTLPFFSPPPSAASSSASSTGVAGEDEQAAHSELSALLAWHEQRASRSKQVGELLKTLSKLKRRLGALRGDNAGGNDAAFSTRQGLRLGDDDLGDGAGSLFGRNLFGNTSGNGSGWVDRSGGAGATAPVSDSDSLLSL